MCQGSHLTLTPLLCPVLLSSPLFPSRIAAASPHTFKGPTSHAHTPICSRGVAWRSIAQDPEAFISIRQTACRLGFKFNLWRPSLLSRGYDRDEIVRKNLANLACFVNSKNLALNVNQDKGANINLFLLVIQ